MKSAVRESAARNTKTNVITKVDEQSISETAYLSVEPTMSAESAEQAQITESQGCTCPGFRTHSGEAKTTQTNITCLKWDYAESELRGVAEAIQMLSAGAEAGGLSGLSNASGSSNAFGSSSTSRSSSSSSTPKTSCAPKIGVVAPNYTWATQMQQACKRVDCDTTVCLAVPEQARVAQQVFTTLTLLVDPTDTQAADILCRLGVSPEAQAELVERYGSAHGLTLVHGLGLDALAPFAHALRHRTGDEDAATLLELLRRESIAPTMHDLHGVIPIMDWASLQGTYDWLLLIGCVEGLLPETVFATSTETATEPQRLDTAETVPFADALQRASNIVISHFAKIDEATAQAFGITHVRTKQEGDRRIALARSCSHIKAVLPALPTTEGGEAFLNRLRTRNGILS